MQISCMVGRLNRIHILGASGSGTTTLGRALSVRRNCRFLDTDDYFWKAKYSEVNKAEDRITLIRNEIGDAERWVLSGSLCGWGDIFIELFDLVVFIYLPNEIRMARLKERERLRYGNDILPGGNRYSEYVTLIEWSARYDEAGPEIRSRIGHEQWLSTLKCPILRLAGESSVEEKLTIIEQFGHSG